MPEILLHYIWQKGLFLSFPQATTDGRKIEILNLGVHNTDAGPDFSNVRIRIDGIELVGNVEMHVYSSDWYRHHHDSDRAYDHIILHVVRHVDKKVFNSQGEAVLQMQLNYPSGKDYLQMMMADARLMDTAVGTHRCAARLLQNPTLLTDGWKRTLLRDRLECKQRSIAQILSLTHNDWEQVLYVTLAHHMGFHVNGIPMEMLAIRTPLFAIRKHRNSLLQVNALLLGQSGLLPQQDPLYKEYRFLQTKFGLEPMDPAVWKHARMRPCSFPEVRIRQMAQLLCAQEGLMSQILELHNLDGLRALFAATQMGRDSIDILLINVVAPIKYAKGQKDEAMALLEMVPAENNSVIRQWKTLGQKVANAADTQALIHLYMSYCQPGQCYNCDVAYQIFAQQKS